MAGKVDHEKRADKELRREFFRQLEQKRALAQEGILEVKTLLILLAAANDEKSAEEIYVPHLARIIGTLVDKTDEPLEEMDGLIVKQAHSTVEQTPLAELCDKLECQRNEAVSGVFKIRTILALLDHHDRSVKDISKEGITLFSIVTVLQDFADKMDASLNEMDGFLIEYPDVE